MSAQVQQYTSALQDLKTGDKDVVGVRVTVDEEERYSTGLNGIPSTHITSLEGLTGGRQVERILLVSLLETERILVRARVPVTELVISTSKTETIFSLRARLGAVMVVGERVIRV